MRYLVEEGKAATFHHACDFCDKIIGSPGFNWEEGNDVLHASPITISFPFGHCHDTMSYAAEFCSDTCAIKFLQKSIEEHGEYNAGTDVKPLIDLEEERKNYDY